jgi:hypothetical protein
LYFNEISAAMKQTLADALKENYSLVELYSIGNSELDNYLGRNRNYQEAQQAFSKLRAITNIQKFFTQAQAIVEQLASIEKYPKATELKKKIKIFITQQCFKLNEWENALTLHPELLSEPEVYFSFAEWLIRLGREEIPAALALDNNNAERNRLGLAMLLLAEANKGNQDEARRYEIETHKRNIAHRIIQNSKNEDETNKIGLTAASLAEIAGVERLISTAEWQAAIEQAGKAAKEEETKKTLNALAQQVESYTVEDIRILSSHSAIKNSLKTLYGTEKCLPVGVLLLSPKSLPWKNQGEDKSELDLNQWFLRRQREQHFASKKEEKREVVAEKSLGDIESFKQQAIEALSAAAREIAEAREQEEERAEEEASAKAEAERQREKQARSEVTAAKIAQAHQYHPLFTKPATSDNNTNDSLSVLRKS